MGFDSNEDFGGLSLKLHWGVLFRCGSQPHMYSHPMAKLHKCMHMYMSMCVCVCVGECTCACVQYAYVQAHGRPQGNSCTTNMCGFQPEDFGGLRQ